MKISIKASDEYHIFFVADYYEFSDDFFKVRNDGKYFMMPVSRIDNIEIEPEWEHDAQ